MSPYEIRSADRDYGRGHIFFSVTTIAALVAFFVFFINPTPTSNGWLRRPHSTDSPLAAMLNRQVISDRWFPHAAKSWPFNVSFFYVINIKPSSSASTRRHLNSRVHIFPVICYQHDLTTWHRFSTDSFDREERKRKRIAGTPYNSWALEQNHLRFWVLSTDSG